MTPTGKSPARRSHHSTIVLAVASALAIAIHIGLGGILLANSGWTIAADGVLAIVLGKVVLIVLGRFAVRRRKVAHAHIGLSEHDDDAAGASHQ